MDSKWTTLIAVAIATFMLLLDVTIVNVALPDIQSALDADFNALRWVIDSYALTLAATLLIFGSLADRIGRRRVFTIGLAVFSLISLACAFAWDGVALDVLRGVQGLGGAAMLATSLALIGATYEGRDRNTAFAVWGATAAGSVAIGPLVGGALVDSVGWESIFLINVPIGLITAALVARGVGESRDPSATGAPDFAGLVTIAGSMSLLVLALFEGNERGWGSALILTLFGAAAALLAAFVAIELRVRQPLLDLGLFRKPTTAGASLAILAVGTGVFAMLTFLVFYIQNTLGYDAFETGLRLLPLTIASFFAAAVGGRLADRFPLRGLIAVGLVIAAVGLLLTRRVDPSSDWESLLAGGIVIGIGVGLVNPAVANAALGVASRAQSGMASGLNSSFRLLGVAIGVAGLGAVLEGRVGSRLAELLGGPVPSGLTDVVATGDVGAAAAQAPAGQQEQVASAARDAFVSGFDEVALVAALIVFAGALAAALLVRGRDLVLEEQGAAPPGSAELRSAASAAG